MIDSQPASLPQIQFGDHRLSRLILGANPINGGSHLSRFVNNQMKQYFTPEQIQTTLSRCQAEGINTWQSGTGNLAAYQDYIDDGGQMQYIALAADSADSQSDDNPTMLDDLVGRILHELSALGLTEDTVVVFSTDHGDMMGAHRLIEKGPFTYEQCYRLPMIAAHPACEAQGSVCDAFVYLHDLFPTFLEMAGLTPPDAPDSQSILANILGRDAPTERDSIYSAFLSQIFPFEQRMLRTRTHKFVYNRSDFGELYDMVNDPWEMRNLIDLPETHELQEALMAKMREHMVRLEDPILRQFDGIRDVY